MNTPFIIGTIVGQIAGAAIGCLIAAFFVQIATNIAAGFKPSYGMAYAAAFVSYLASLVLGFAVGFALGTQGGQLGGTEVILTMVLGFIVQSFFYGIMLKDDDDEPIGFNKGALVYIIQLVILIGIALLIAALIFGIFMLSQ